MSCRFPSLPIRWLALTMTMSIVGMAPAIAQTQPNEAGKLSTANIPDSAIGAVYLFPGDILDNPEFKLLPTEVASAWTKENVGVDITDVASATMIIGMPGPAGPEMGVVVQLKSDFSIMQVNRQFLDGAEESLEGLQAYHIADTPNLFLHVANPRMLVIGTPQYIPEIIAAKKPNGALASFASTIPHISPLMAVLVTEPVREPLRQVFAQMPPQIPPPLQALSELPELAQGIVLAGGISSRDKLRLLMMAEDESAAGDIEEIVNNALRFGRDIAEMQAMGQIEGSGAVPEATRNYVKRLSTEIVEMLKPKRTGKRVMIEVENQGGMATSGVLVGLLLPAVQAARESARRMSATNNMKQVMLALHNYHDTYGHFPEAVSRDEDGNPLLSWRVAILPFVEQADLYDQFHLDEPWDSEHNLSLLALMPAIYADPSIPLEPGMTVMHAPTGEQFAFTEDGTVALRNVTDGTSNTLALVEGNRTTALPWTSPEFLEIDMEDPLANLGGNRAGGFTAALMDGSVRFISQEIDLETFLALLTRNGGEVVRGF